MNKKNKRYFMAIGSGKYIIVDRKTKEKIVYESYRKAENKLIELNLNMSDTAGPSQPTQKLMNN